MNVPIEIQKVRSRESNREYYLATPSADTDMATDGVILLASKIKKEIQILYVSAEDYPLGPYKGAEHRAEEENAIENRDDLAPVGIDLKSKSLFEHIGRFAYFDIHDTQDRADPIEHISIDDYLKIGGVVIDKR